MPAEMYTLCDTEVLVKKYGLNKSHNTHDYATCKAMTELYKGIRVLNCRIKISEPDTYYMAQNIIQKKLLQFASKWLNQKLIDFNFTNSSFGLHVIKEYSEFPCSL